MNFRNHHLRLIGFLLLTGVLAAAASLYLQTPGRLNGASTERNATGSYSCPMHPDVMRAKPGACPKCGMALTAASSTSTSHQGCPSAGPNRHSCCAQPPETTAAANRRLPPGHPPVPGWTTNGTPETAPPPIAATHSSP